jgi:hypothetical protein
MKTMKIRIYADPGHAWAAIKRDTLIKLGIADKITTYSYQRNDMAYLEEDCDLSTLISAARNAGITLTFDERHTNKRSKIRSYEYYRC